MSPFMLLINSKCDHPIITVNGMNHATFVYIFKQFEPVYNWYTPYATYGRIKMLSVRDVKRGRPRV